MLDKIPFFPTPFPDETLHSLVTRYRLLACYPSTHRFNTALFGSGTTDLSSINPVHLTHLARKIPGCKTENYLRIIKNNTLLPLFLPFLDLKKPFPPASESLTVASKHFLATRANQGRVKYCPICIKDDHELFGASYWHRAHQIPAVLACWKHNVYLSESCPKCRLPLYSRNTKLLALTSGCTCGWHPSKGGEIKKCDDFDINLANFARKVLEAELPMTNSLIIRRLLQRNAHKISIRMEYYGFNNANPRDLIINNFGINNLKKIDPDYQEQCRRFWNFNSHYPGLLERIQRCLIISLFVFKNFENFSTEILSLHETNLNEQTPS